MAVNGVTVIALEWGIFVPLTTVFVLIRFIVRYLYPSKFTALGNWLVGLAFALYLLAPSLDTVVWQAGFYNDKAALEAPVSDDSTVYGLKAAYADWIMFYVTLGVIKGAILSVYYQIIPRDSKVLWVSLHALSLATVMAFLTTLLLNLVWCRPIKLNWSLDPEETCFAPFDTTVIVITGAMQVAIDVAIVILPFPLLLAVNASTGEKASIAAVFAMGVLSIAATVSRLIWSFATESLELYTLIARTELTVSMIVACSPALRVLATQTSTSAATASQSGIFAHGALGGPEPVSRFSRPTTAGTHATEATSLPPLHSQRRRPQLDGRRFSLLTPLNLHHHSSNKSIGQTSVAHQHLLHSQRSSLSGVGSLMLPRSPGQQTAHTRDGSRSTYNDTIHSPAGWTFHAAAAAAARPSNLTDRPSYDLILLRTPSTRSRSNTATTNTNNSHARNPSNATSTNTANSPRYWNPGSSGAIPPSLNTDAYAPVPSNTPHARGPSLTAALLPQTPPPATTTTTTTTMAKHHRPAHATTAPPPPPLSPISPISLPAPTYPSSELLGGAGPSPQPSIEDMYFGRSDFSVADLERMDEWERLDVLDAITMGLGYGEETETETETGEREFAADAWGVGMAVTTGEGERVSGVGALLDAGVGGEAVVERRRQQQQHQQELELLDMRDMADWAERSWGWARGGGEEEKEEGEERSTAVSGGAQRGWANGTWKGKGKGAFGGESAWV